MAFFFFEKNENNTFVWFDVLGFFVGGGCFSPQNRKKVTVISAAHGSPCSGVSSVGLSEKWDRPSFVETPNLPCTGGLYRP